LDGAPKFANENDWDWSDSTRRKVYDYYGSSLGLLNAHLQSASRGVATFEYPAGRLDICASFLRGARRKARTRTDPQMPADSSVILARSSEKNISA
jgi:hypothetical protein